jgi:ssDNA-binding Zn-finger/Zn-ribbon topoisomerase 1
VGEIYAIECPDCQMQTRLYFGCGSLGCSEFSYCHDCQEILETRFRESANQLLRRGEIPLGIVQLPLPQCPNNSSHRIEPFEIPEERLTDKNGLPGGYELLPVTCPRCGFEYLDIGQCGDWD